MKKMLHFFIKKFCSALFSINNDNYCNFAAKERYFMEQCLGEWFIINGHIESVENFRHYQLMRGFSIYEIVRVEKKVPLFLEDHLQRMYHSLELENKTIQEDMKTFTEQLRMLIDKNQFEQGKIKIIANFSEATHKESYNLLLFFTPYTFPSAEQYKQGVRTILCTAVRKDPNAKVLETEARKIADRKIEETGVYEALLVDYEGYIHEGSRSNFFVIKDQTVITPPDDSVLQGIARKNVLAICQENQISYNIRPIHQRELNSVDSVFITGTSPKVLPVCQVNELPVKVENELMRLLMKKYDEAIENYIMKK
jgi:branched-chain amino acid aminotransferase